MSEKLYEIKQNSDGKYWLFNNERNSCLMISENIASLLDICTVLNEQSDTIQGLLLDRNRQEEKLDIARRNLSKQLEKIDEQQATNSALRTENNHLIDVIKEYAKKYEEQQATIRKLQDLCGESDGENAKLRIENKKLKAKLKEKEEDERLYADEIVKLNKEAKEVLDFKSLGGNY